MDHRCSLRALFLVVVLSGCQGGAADAPPPAEACLAAPISMTGDGSVAEPPSCMQGCMDDSECTVVNTSCPGCCEYVALSKSYLAHYEKFTLTECKKYHGLECGCDEKPGKPACVDYVCTLPY